MQDTHDMTLELEAAAPVSPRTTTAGLETWLTDVQTVEMPRADVETQTFETPERGAIELQEEIGPVNAAEAIVLGTISAAHKLVGPDGAELLVDPEQDAYYFESNSLKPLAALLQQPASAWTPIYSEALKTARTANTPQRLERLRWYAGLVATPGILSRQLNRAGRYKLSHWPETEREFPKHFRIAKEMLRSAATADEITAASNTPYEEVVDYINASHAGGRLDANPMPQPSDNAPAPSRRERLMARLNKPLFAH